MVTASVITTGLNAVILALTPIERWNAAGRLNSASTDHRWFIIIGVITGAGITTAIWISELETTAIWIMVGTVVIEIME